MAERTRLKQKWGGTDHCASAPQASDPAGAPEESLICVRQRGNLLAERKSQAALSLPIAAFTYISGVWRRKLAAHKIFLPANISGLKKGRRRFGKLRPAAALQICAAPKYLQKEIFFHG
jgi:hypothetical protein